MLPNTLTGELREVDVVLRAKTAGHETVVAIEAAGRTRRATVDWVEQMIGKHKNLPTDKVVLVSESGFSRQARILARGEQMVPVTPQDAAADDLARQVVNALPSLWPKTVTLAPDSASVWVSRSDESEIPFNVSLNLPVVFDDGSVLSDLMTFYKNNYAVNMSQMMEQIGLADITEDVESSFDLQIGPPVDVQVKGQPRSLFVWSAEREPVGFHRIAKIVVHGTVSIHVSEIQLTQRRLGEINVRYAYGEGMLGGIPALAVFTEDDEHGGKLTIRVRNRD